MARLGSRAEQHYLSRDVIHVSLQNFSQKENHDNLIPEEEGPPPISLYILVVRGFA